MRYATAVLAFLVVLANPVGVWAQSASPIARVVELTNVERAKAGLRPLVPHPQLMGASQGYAEVLAPGPCFGHTCGSVPNLTDRVERAGYTDWANLGENVAGGQPTPEAVVAAWMTSEGHRRNILNPAFTEIGVGMAAGGGQYGLYWTQAFDSRRSGAPAVQAVPAAPSVQVAPVPAAPPSKAVKKSAPKRPAQRGLKASRTAGR